MLPRLTRALPWMAPAVLFLGNAVLIRELFGIEYPASMYSIASAYIGLARHYIENWDQLLWFPYWYGGLPMMSTYPPLLHGLVAAAAAGFALSPAKAYHVVTATFYCLVPVAVYGCALVLSRSPISSFFAGWMSTLISPSAILLSWVREDLGGWAYPRRLQALYTYGEGPHVASLAWIFLVILLLHLALERQSGVWRVLAAGAMGATVLTNTIGAVGMVLAIFAYLAAREDGSNWRRWGETALLGTLGYLLIAPFVPVSTLIAVRANAPYVGGVFQGSALSYTLLAAHLLVGAWLAVRMRRMGFCLLLRFAVAAAVPLGGITLSESVYGMQLLPQATRYHLEFELCLLLGVAAFGRLAVESFPRQRWLPWTLAAILLLGTGMQWRSTRWYARNHLKGGVVEDTIEFQSARWFDQNMRGSRVMTPGSIAQWFRAFTTVEQLGGGYDNGAQNVNFLRIHYQILSGDGAGDREAEIATTWLKAMGVDAVQVSYPESTEVFHPYRNPAKFDGVLEEIWRHRDTRVYRVPRRQGGFAAVIPEEAVPSTEPVNGLDTAEAERYVAAMEDPSIQVPDWQWRSTQEARIGAAVGEGQVVSVQVAHHSGWRAENEAGESIPIQRDGLGQIVLRPGPGNHRIRLIFTGGLEMTVLRMLSGLGLALCLFLLAPALRRSR